MTEIEVAGIRYRRYEDGRELEDELTDLRAQIIDKRSLITVALNEMKKRDAEIKRLGVVIERYCDALERIVASGAYPEAAIAAEALADDEDQETP